MGENVLLSLWGMVVFGPLSFPSPPFYTTAIILLLFMIMLNVRRVPFTSETFRRHISIPSLPPSLSFSLPLFPSIHICMNTFQQADLFTVQVHPGDVVVCGTDGLFDNVYPEEILSIVAAAKEEGWDANKTAARLAKYAKRRAADEKYISPFAYGALSRTFFDEKCFEECSDPDDSLSFSSSPLLAFDCMFAYIK